MTTIAIKDGVIAVDTLIMGDLPYGNGRKLGRSKDGWWLAGSGRAAVTMNAIRWASTRSLGRLRTPWKGLPDDWEKSSLLALNAEGRMFFFEGHGPVEFDAPYVAEGSGSHLAMGAMAMGATAVEAVLVAMAHDPNTGGNVEYATTGGALVTVVAGRPLKR